MSMRFRWKKKEMGKDLQGGLVGAVVVRLRICFLADSAWEGHLPLATTPQSPP